MMQRIRFTGALAAVLVGILVQADARGTVSELEPMMNPFTAADPGSPAHLGTAYGSATPWFMVVGEEGLDVYARA